MFRSKGLFLSVCGLFVTLGVHTALADGGTTVLPAPTSPAAPASAKADSAYEMSPYQLKLQYIGEEWDNTQGALRSGTVYMQNIDTQLRIDTDKAFGWTGGKALFEGYYNSSRSIANQKIGATFDSSSPIDTYGARRFALYQAYYDQNFGRTDLLLGIWDPQSEFANSDQQNVFLNRNFTWNSALDLSGVSLNYAGNYPWTTAAFRARREINDDWTVQAAILNGMKDNVKYPGVTDFIFRGSTGVTGIAEVNYAPAARTKAYVGYWGYTGKQNVYDQYNADTTNKMAYGSDGGYIGGATRLYTQQGKRGLDIFANLGIANPDENAIDHSLNTGLTYTGLIDARPNDRMGIAITFNGASDPYRKDQLNQSNNPAHYEKDFELTYHAKINDWLKVQPDFQYIVHPNLRADLKDAVLFGIHFEIGHWFGL